MRKSGLLHRSFTLLITILVFALGMFSTIPKEVGATPDKSKDGTCVECHSSGEHGTGGPGGAGERAKSEKTANPVTEEVHYSLFIGGFVVAIFVLGGTAWMRKRK